MNTNIANMNSCDLVIRAKINPPVKESGEIDYQKILESFVIPIDAGIQLESVTLGNREYLDDNDHYTRGVKWLKEHFVDTNRIPRQTIIDYEKAGMIDALLPEDFHYKYEKSHTGKWIKRKHPLNPRKYAFMDGELIKLG